MSNEKVDYLQVISDFIFTSKYARFNEKYHRRETWDEAVTRVQNMHLKKYSFLSTEDKNEIKEAFNLVRQKLVAPSMRAMQFGGKAVEKINLRQYNCAVRHVDSLRSFAEIFYLALCGCGIGIGVSPKFLNRLPDLVNADDKTGMVTSYVIADTIEGWADSIEALLMCYFKNTPFTGRKLVFDYSRIRKKGAPLKTGGGKAPGYKGLKNSHIKIKALLDHIIEYNKQTRLRSIDAYDILMHCMDAVLSGGVRRSATSLLFDKEDNLMINAKTFSKADKVYSFDEDGEVTVGGHTTKLFRGKVEVEGIKHEITVKEWELESLKKDKLVNWWHINPQRARSNNSVLLLRDKTTKDEFKQIVERTKQFGEPGFAFVNDENTLLNPCFTIDTKILTDRGWRTFGELLNTEPNIIQDSRVKGYVENGEEKWKFNLKNVGTEVNKATNVRKTGEKQDIYQITSFCGRQVKVTGNHLFATQKGKMVEAKNLKQGDKLLIAIPEAHNPNKESIEYKTGFVAGIVQGDGCISNDAAIVDLWESDDVPVKQIQTIINEVCEKDLQNQKTHKKASEFSLVRKTDVYEKYRLSSTSLLRVLNRHGFVKNDLAWLHKTSKDFKSGYLAGLFYSDGHVDFHENNGSFSLRITSIHFEVLQDVQLICQELGLFSRIYNLLPARETLLPDGKGGSKLYACKPSYRIIIRGKENCVNAVNILSVFNTEKINKANSILKNIKAYKNSLKTFLIVEQVCHIGKEDVYCLSEDNNRTLIAEGFTARRCFEISFIPISKDGVCGVQMCNLTTMNGRLLTDLEAFKKASKASAIIGTLQAGYTDFPYLSKVSEQLTEEEALLGCSITGQMDNPSIILDESNQKICAKIILDTNEEWAKKIGIQPAARTTCTKPEGTASLLLGTASGIHPHHARRYFRRVQCNKVDPVYKFFKSHNKHMAEPSIWSANHTDDVLTFTIEVNDKALIKEDFTALQHLEIIKKTQQNWVLTGTSKYNKKDVAHNVSCTVIVDTHEWDDVINYIYDNREYFTAVSLLPKTGDKLYPQAPMEAVIDAKDEERWKFLTENLKLVDYSTMFEDDDETNLTGEVACAGGACEIVKT